MISTDSEHRGGPKSGHCPARAYRGELKPTWCAGCGDFGVMTALFRAVGAVGRPAHEIAFVSGIGCSGQIPGYSAAYGFNSLQGRALPIAQGIKIARPELLVLVVGGDADGASIGGGYLPHAIRRNPDLTYLVVDSGGNGKTDGQFAATDPAARGGELQRGALEALENPILFALTYGANFVAQGLTADLDGLAKMIEDGIRYPGFAFINVKSPCLGCGDLEMQVLLQKAKMRKLSSMGHDSSDLERAIKIAREDGDSLHTGVFYRNPNPPATFGSKVKELKQRPAKAAAEAVG
jgi:2-oxoglutarate/2-oxoacid ferredoxin oxidoreductase subunit beta